MTLPLRQQRVQAKAVRVRTAEAPLGTSKGAVTACNSVCTAAVLDLLRFLHFFTNLQFVKLVFAFKQFSTRSFSANCDVNVASISALRVLDRTQKADAALLGAGFDLVGQNFAERCATSHA